MKYKILILLIALLLGLLSVWPSLVEPSLAQPGQQQTACYGAQGGTKQTADDGCEYEFQDGSTLDVQAGADVTFASDVTFSGTVTQSGVAVSGPLRFGSASDVVTGTTIAHGLSTTPTTVLLTPVYNGVLTQSLYVISTDATSITVGISDVGDVITFTTIYWAAGK